MSLIRKHLQKIKDFGANKLGATDVQSEDSSPSGADTPKSSFDKRRSRELIKADRHLHSVSKERAKAEEVKKQSLARIEDERFLREGPPELTQLYRPYSMNMSKHWSHEKRALFKELDWESEWDLWDTGGYLLTPTETDGQMITFRARIHTLRRLSARLVFIVFRQQTITIQGVLEHHVGSIASQFQPLWFHGGHPNTDVVRWPTPGHHFRTNGP